MDVLVRRVVIARVLGREVPDDVERDRRYQPGRYRFGD
jgi:hypothetical protein